jgi:uncharacterized cupin superfamily protein
LFPDGIVEVLGSFSHYFCAESILPLPSIVCSRVDVELRAAPINRNWILEGSPTAQNCELSRSKDGCACTLIWECTPGKFEWHYGVDETIHILRGCVVLDDGNRPPRRLGQGDVVFFPAGAVVTWTVEERVRKLAFFRRALPMPISFLARAISKTRRLMRPGKRAAAPSPATGEPLRPCGSGDSANAFPVALTSAHDDLIVASRPFLALSSIAPNE